MVLGVGQYEREGFFLTCNRERLSSPFVGREIGLGRDMTEWCFPFFCPHLFHVHDESSHNMLCHTQFCFSVRVPLCFCVCATLTKNSVCKLYNIY
jgi:hypothetical protein